MAINLFRKAGYGVTIAVAVAFSSSTSAEILGLQDTPLYLSTAVPPNLIMAIDDSGSMDFEVLFPGNDGSAWWRAGTSDTCDVTGNNSFVGCIANSSGTADIPSAGRLNFNNDGNSNGTWKKYSYLFPNGLNTANNSARRRLGDNVNDHFAIPPLPSLAWSRSHVYNAAYFNPSSPYQPWVNGGGYSFTDANEEATRFDPVFEPTVTINLTQDIAGTGNSAVGSACSNAALPARGNHYDFQVYTGMVLPPGTCFRSERNDTQNWQEVRAVGQGCRVGVTNECYTSEGNNNRITSLPSDTAVAIRYYPATFYLPATTALPDSYSSYNKTPLAGTAPDGTALKGYEIKSGNFNDVTQYNNAIQNFANWFQYYRKRHQALRAGLGKSFNTVTGMRVDGFTINTAVDFQVTMRNIDTPANRNLLYSRFYSEWVRSGGTPNRTAVATMIDNFRRTDRGAPVISACQKNFGILFTDGFTNAPANGDGIMGVYGNEDGGAGKPYSDTYSGSLADAVFSAYSDPLRDDFPAGKVNVPTTCPTTGTYSGPLDCNRNLHMNFYAVTLGTRGLLFNPDTVPAVNPYTVDPALAWPTTFPPRHPSAVDDLWHAAINGRGQLLNARSPQEISDKLGEVLSSIKDGVSTAAAASVNSGSISSDTRLFQSKFNSDGWTGKLIAYSLNTTNGNVQSAVWEASDKMPAPDQRNIYTTKSNGQRVAFTWDALKDDVTRVRQLDPDSNVTRAEAVLNYLRGDISNEGTGATNFRRRRDDNGRSNVLGDIVSSGALYVGTPPFRYRDSMESAAYSTFVGSNDEPGERPGMVYVGANDGMLHAFYADGANEGKEAFAFIPSTVFPRLRNLSLQTYTHQYFVDGSPSMGDAFFGGAWHTVLAAGLNKGGQGIYVIDITKPQSVNASSLLWEVNDQTEPELGYTFSQPTIAKLRDGKWYVVFGNGYNSRVDDGSASTTGNAVLFLLNLETGVVTKIDTGVGTAQAEDLGVSYDNGLATPSLVDVNGDRVIDYAYAGDLYGNMWKFDLTATTPDAWNVAFGGDPLYQARDASGNVQPITVRPEVARGPMGNGVIVLFGTGKYLEPGDKLRTPERRQRFYGIIDRNAAVTGDLLQQRILFEGPARSDSTRNYDDSYEVRVTTNNQLELDNQGQLVSKGWYIDLVSPRGYEGEKQVSSPIVRNGAVIFTTIIPNSDPCDSGGTSWLMELDMLDGSRLDVTPFDLTGDGEFDDNDDIVVELPEGDAGNGGTGQDSAGDNVGNGDGDTGTASSSGMKGNASDGMFAGPPGVVDGDRSQGRAVQYKYLPGSKGNIRKIVENPRPGAMGRQSWRQVR